MVRPHPGSFEFWSVSVLAARLLGKEEGRVQFPDGPLGRTQQHGLLFQWETPGLQPGNRGSIPRRSTEQNDGAHGSTNKMRRVDRLAGLLTTRG